MTQTIMPNGDVYTSTALVPQSMDTTFQLLTTQMLGIAADLSLQCGLVAGSNVLTTPLVLVNLAPGFFAVGNGIVFGSYITGLAGAGTNLLITLNNDSTISGVESIGFYDPVSYSKVRISWQTEGSPAFAVTDDVIFIRCIEDIDTYSHVRNETWVYNNNNTATRTRVYTRSWNVAFRAYGPNSFDTIRLIKSMLLENWSHDTLAALQLYLNTEMSTPLRVPELFEGRWWEAVDFNVDLLEQVNETLVLSTVASVEVVGAVSTGDDFKVLAQIK